MKFITMLNIIRTNTLFSKLKTIDPRRSIEIEAYSCKQTRHQKSHKNMPKPLRFYISTLELTFPGHDFSNVPINMFRFTNLDAIRSEVSFVLFTIYKNQNDVSELLSFLDTVLAQSVSLRSSLFYSVDVPLISDDANIKAYMIHDRKKRRIIVLKIAENK